MQESIVFRELLLHYLDANLHSTTDTVILHIGVNDLLKDMSINNNFTTFMKNVEHMVQKCRRFGAKLVFLSGVVHTRRIAWQILNDVHDRLVSLCKRLEINYIENRNIRETHLFKDGLHLLDAGKQILANNLIFNLNNFFMSNGTTNLTHLTNNLESNNDKLTMDQKKELSSSRPLCNRNDAVPENCKNEDMYNTSNINNPCDAPSILNNLKLKKYI